MNLEHLLRKVDPVCGTLHLEPLLSMVASNDDHGMAFQMPVEEGPSTPSDTKRFEPFGNSLDTGL